MILKTLLVLAIIQKIVSLDDDGDPSFKAINLGSLLEGLF